MADEKRKSSASHTESDKTKLKMWEETTDSIAKELMQYELDLERKNRSQKKLEEIQLILVNLFETIQGTYTEVRNCTGSGSLKRRLFALEWRCIDIEKKYSGAIDTLLFTKRLHNVPDLIKLNKYPPIKD